MKNLRKRLAKNNQLTPKEQRFVEEYLLDLNGTQAAIRSGYSAKTAHVIAMHLVNKSLVKKAIAEAIRSRSERTRIDADWVLEALKRTYFQLVELNESDISDIFNGDGSLKPIHQWPHIWRQKEMIRQLEIQETRVAKDGKKRTSSFLKKVTWAELKTLELKVLELIGRHVDIGAFEERIQSPREVTLKVEYVDRPSERAS